MSHLLPVTKEFNMRRRKNIRLTIFLLTLLIVLALLSLMLGNTYYSLTDILQIFKEGVQNSFTMYSLRLPRMLNGILCGIAFGMAGNTFQKLLGNPLASPDIIGVSLGASVGAIFCILVLNLSGVVVSIAAVASGLITSFFLFMLAKKDQLANGRLILIGIGTQAFLYACISYLLLRAAQYDVASALRWLSGSLNQVTMNNAFFLSGAVILLGGILYAMSRYLHILELGNAFSVTLGVNIKIGKAGMFLCAILLIAFATSISGPIASIAFLSGPIATKLNKSGSSNLVQAGLIGAILVLGANLIAQNAFEARYPVGVITGLLGAPFLLFQLLRLNKNGEKI